jgi:hypothetical protein
VHCFLWGREFLVMENNFLPLKHYLIFVYPSIVPSKLHGIISFKFLSNDLRVGAIEIDYKWPIHGDQFF